MTKFKGNSDVVLLIIVVVFVGGFCAYLHRNNIADGFSYVKDWERDPVGWCERIGDTNCSEKTADDYENEIGLSPISRTYKGPY